jgi:hypothetical protein
MKLLSPLNILIVAAAAALAFKQGRHGVPETDSRTVTTATARIPVVGVEEFSDRYVLLGKDGPIVVSGISSAWDAISRIDLSHVPAIAKDAVAVGVAQDPKDAASSLVVAWKRTSPRQYP